MELTKTIECFTLTQLGERLNERYVRVQDVGELVATLAAVQHENQELKNRENQSHQIIPARLQSGVGSRVLPFPTRGIIDVPPTTSATPTCGDLGDGGQQCTGVRPTNTIISIIDQSDGIRPNSTDVDGKPA